MSHLIGRTMKTFVPPLRTHQEADMANTGRDKENVREGVNNLNRVFVSSKYAMWKYAMVSLSQLG